MGLARTGTRRTAPVVAVVRVDRTITAAMLLQAAIYSMLDTDTKAEAQQAWAAAHHLHPDTSRPKELLRSRPKDLIATCIIMLWLNVVLAHVSLRSDALKRR